MASLLSIEKKALNTISEYMKDQSETLAISESVTSGLIQSRFSLAVDATEFFHGGITAYNLGQKTRLLNVDPIIADRANCVSEVVARQMAINVAELFSCPWGISITGYAVPVPALKIRTCFAIYAFSYKREVTFVRNLRTKLKGASNVQRHYSLNVIKDFADHLVSRK